MPKMQVGSVELYYELHGSGDPVVLIGGLAGDCRAWKPQIEVLSKDYRILAFDNRGTGQSSAPEEPYTTRDFADDTIGLMNALDLPAAHVIGRSMGGAVAQEMAINYPDRVRSMLVTASFGKMDRYGARLLLNIMEVTKTQGYEAAARHQSVMLYPLAYFNEHPEEMDAFEKVLADPNRALHGYVNSTLACVEHDSLDRLGQVKCPTLVLAGELDLVCSIECAREIARGIPGAELKIYKDAGHFFLVQCFQECLSDIQSFLAKH